METQTKTKKKSSLGLPDSHYGHDGQKLHFGMKALCGVTLLGIEARSGLKVCPKCREIYMRGRLFA